METLELDKIYEGNVSEVIKEFPDKSVDCVITSPPYWGLRDYGVSGQLGLEKTPDEYVTNMVEVFREIKRVLKDAGTLWLNLGDSYIGSWGNYSGQNRGAGRQRKIVNGSKAQNPAYEGLENWRPPTTQAPGLKSKDLVGIPWKVAFALQADGWYLRQDIIWAKPNPMPESVLDRCTKAHEYIFLLSKSPRYYYDAASIKTASKNPADDVRRMSAQKQENKSNPTDKINGLRPRKTWPERKLDGAPMRYGEQSVTPALNNTVVDGTANKRSVWVVPNRPSRGVHRAAFPEDLVSPMIKAGCPEGGIVFDPFMGSGTTAVVAKKLKRSYVGIELNPVYIDMAAKRLGAVQVPLL